jgi:hypothetical protein
MGVLCRFLTFDAHKLLSSSTIDYLASDIKSVAGPFISSILFFLCWLQTGKTHPLADLPGRRFYNDRQ